MVDFGVEITPEGGFRIGTLLGPDEKMVREVVTYIREAVFSDLIDMVVDESLMDEEE